MFSPALLVRRGDEHDRNGKPRRRAAGARNSRQNKAPCRGRKGKTTVETQDNGQVRTSSEIALIDLTDRAEDLTAGLMVGIETDWIAPVALPLWHAGHELYGEHSAIDERHTPNRRLAYILLLDAVLASPEAVMQGLRRMRDDLMANEPAAALLR